MILDTPKITETNEYTEKIGFGHILSLSKPLHGTWWPPLQPTYDPWVVHFIAPPPTSKPKADFRGFQSGKTDNMSDIAPTSANFWENVSLLDYFGDLTSWVGNNHKSREKVDGFVSNNCRINTKTNRNHESMGEIHGCDRGFRCKITFLIENHEFTGEIHGCDRGFYRKIAKYTDFHK